MNEFLIEAKIDVKKNESNLFLYECILFTRLKFVCNAQIK